MINRIKYESSEKSMVIRLMNAISEAGSYDTE